MGEVKVRPETGQEEDGAAVFQRGQVLQARTQQRLQPSGEGFLLCHLFLLLVAATVGAAAGGTLSDVICRQAMVEYLGYLFSWN